MSDIPTTEEMYNEIMKRKDLDPQIRTLFEMLERNAMKRLELLCSALTKHEEITWPKKEK